MKTSKLHITFDILWHQRLSSASDFYAKLGIIDIKFEGPEIEDTYSIDTY